MFRIWKRGKNSTQDTSPADNLESSGKCEEPFSEKRLKRFPWRSRRSIRKLAEYELPSGFEERLVLEFPFDRMSYQEIAECMTEFKKFIAVLIINKDSREKVAMTSQIVDEVWHTFILFTLEYEKFSQAVYGSYIHHTPKTSDTPLGVNSAKNFYDTYRKYFGELHPVWKLRLRKINVPMEENGKDPTDQELAPQELSANDPIGLSRTESQYSKSRNLKGLGLASFGMLPAIPESSSLAADPSKVGLGSDIIKVVQYQLSSKDHISGISNDAASIGNGGSCGGDCGEGGEGGCGGEGGGCGSGGCGGCGGCGD